LALTAGPTVGHHITMEAREKIITTAVRLFSAQGYGNTSLSQVAKEAEVSKALIFWHFDNKETLFRTAVQRTLEPYFINVLDDLAGLSEIDQMKRLIDQYYAFVSKNVYSVKFFLSLILRDEKHPDDLAGHMGELQRVFLNLLVDILQSGREHGLFRDDISPALDAGLVMSALHGILVQGFLGDDDSPERGTRLPEQLKTRLVDALRREPVDQKS
jgi:AcrR family transcriptional regulator